MISFESLEQLEAGREKFVLSVENFHGYVRGKDAKFPMLRKNLGYAVAELDKTYLFGEQNKELALTQQDEVKSVFPSHLVLLDSATGQTVIDQIFHFPKLIEASYMSIPAFRRFRRITHHLRVPEKETCWKRAVGVPVSSFLDGNRARRTEKKGDRQDQNDHFLTQDARLMEPLFVASADRSADCINRTHKKAPCYCLSECIWYSQKKCMFLIWDVDELEGVGLPHENQDVVVFAVKYYLPVRWIAANPSAYLRDELPTIESFTKLDVTMSLSVADVFALFLNADEHCRDSWERSSDDPRERARMLDFINKIARQHHRRYEDQYDAFTLRIATPLQLRVIASFRHPFTGGIKPKKRVNAQQQRAELLRTNVNRVIHEIYSQNKESFHPLPSFNDRLEEQFNLLEERVKRHNELVDQQDQGVTQQQSQ